MSRKSRFPGPGVETGAAPRRAQVSLCVNRNVNHYTNPEIVSIFDLAQN
jgi:hypothetical protein